MIKRHTTCWFQLSSRLYTYGTNPKTEAHADIYAVDNRSLTGLPAQLPEDPNTGEIIWRDHAQVSLSWQRFLEQNGELRLQPAMPVNQSRRCKLKADSSYAL